MVVIVDQALDHIVKMVFGTESEYTGFRWYWTCTSSTAETGSETDLIAPSVVYDSRGIVEGGIPQCEGDWSHPAVCEMTVTGGVIEWWEFWFVYANLRPWHVAYELGWYFGNGDTRVLAMRHVIPEGLDMGNVSIGGATPYPEITLQLTIEAA